MYNVNAMAVENSGEKGIDWTKLFVDGEPSVGNLFDLSKEVFRTHKTPSGVAIDLPPIRIVNINVANPQDTSERVIPGETKITGEDEDASLYWKEGWITLNHKEEPGNEGTKVETISFGMETSSRRHASCEYFDLVRYQSGEVKALWYRPDITHSYILDEDLEEECFEVLLDSKRIKRIGKVLLSASARTAAEDVKEQEEKDTSG